jgi:transcriptional regulator with XRE-family HTH domain
MRDKHLERRDPDRRDPVRRDPDPTGGRGMAAALLRRARQEAGLTQTRLAELADTAQSAIAAYEAGVREPTLPVLTRMLAAAGMRLELDVAPDQSLYRLCDLARDVAAVKPSDERRRLRLVFEFLRGVRDDNQPLALLLSVEPRLTGDERFDALFGGLAEHLSVHAHIDPPAWVHEPSRFLDRAWWVSELSSARASALVHTPASLRRRGVMIDRRDLESR